MDEGTVTSINILDMDRAGNLMQSLEIEPGGATPRVLFEGG